MNQSKISVTSKGSAESTFTSVEYKASIVVEGPTGPAAKEKARPIMDHLQGVLGAYGEAAGLDLARLKTTFDVEATYVNGSDGARRFNGYRATYTATFVGSNVAKAMAFHDAITSIEGVQSPSPNFRMDNLDGVSQRAFQNAAKRAQEKFEGQCAALGLDPKSYAIDSWSLYDEEPRGKTLTFKDVKAEAVGLEPGKAILDVRVTLSFTRVTP